MCISLLVMMLGLLGCGETTLPGTQPADRLTAVPPLPPPGLAHPWLARPARAAASSIARFPAPAGCQRVAVAADSWGEWLRWQPLRPSRTPALLYNGRLKDPQNVIAAVVDIDPGTQDLQQCADTVIRLRAEYLFSQNPNQVHFHLTTGYDFWFSDIIAGRMFRVVGQQVVPAARPKPLATPLWPAT